MQLDVNGLDPDDQPIEVAFDIEALGPSSLIDVNCLVLPQSNRVGVDLQDLGSRSLAGVNGRVLPRSLRIPLHGQVLGSQSLAGRTDRPPVQAPRVFFDAIVRPQVGPLQPEIPRNPGN